MNANPRMLTGQLLEKGVVLAYIFQHTVLKLLFWSIISELMAGIGGMIVTARLDSAQPNAGLMYELDAIAAVVIGGTSLYGGRGTIMGTGLGALLIGVLNNGLVLLNVLPFWQ